MAFLQERRPPPGPATPVWVHPLGRLFAWAVVLVLVLRFFDALELVVLTLLAALSLAAALRPLLRYIPGPVWLLPVIAGLIPVAVVGGLLVLVIWLLAGPVREQISQLPQMIGTVNGVLAHWSAKLGLSHPIAAGELWSAFSNSVWGSSGAVVSSTATTTSDIFVVVVLVFFGTIYVLSSTRDLLGKAVMPLPPLWQPRVKDMWNDLEPQLRWWLLGHLVAMAIVGGASWVGYELVGLKMASALAILAGLSELVPTIGPVIAFLAALMFASAQSTGTVIGVIIVYLVIQILESYVLLPVIMKRAVHIPPLVTLFTVVLWWRVLGIGGLFLAFPLDLVCWSGFEHLVIRPRRGS